MTAFKAMVSVCVVVGLLVATASAVNIATVPVGNPGNVADAHGAGYGSVGYSYNIGKYEVTAGQYTEFLNKVAATDTYGLYNLYMDTANNSHGCNIQRSGTSGSYSYSVASDWANRPVNFVSYWDSCRFANWLHNGQPMGMQGADTTETGVYTLDGYNGTGGGTIQRNANWKWAVTSEDEWYKAAYYKGGSTNAGFWDYPTSSDSIPSNVLGNPTDLGNNATYWNNGYTIDSPYYRTEVGAHENSDSPYGTFDQGGNVWEWNEAVLYGPNRGLRGGAYYYYADYLSSSFRYYTNPYDEYHTVGFRVVSEVPEPASLGLLSLGGLVLLRRKRRA